jgi:hypothetical protein
MASVVAVCNGCGNVLTPAGMLCLGVGAYKCVYCPMLSQAGMRWEPSSYAKRRSAHEMLGVPSTTTCPTCAGSGEWVPFMYRVTCNTCGGSGQCSREVAQRELEGRKR